MEPSDTEKLLPWLVMGVRVCQGEQVKTILWQGKGERTVSLLVFFFAGFLQGDKKKRVTFGQITNSASLRLLSPIVIVEVKAVERYIIITTFPFCPVAKSTSPARSSRSSSRSLLEDHHRHLPSACRQLPHYWWPHARHHSRRTAPPR